MTTFVLVPGAWLGGWCWQRLTPLLRDDGHEVYTPTLTGLGEREHLAHPDIGLDTHVQDIINVLAYEELEEVVLVGHSYSGFVVTSVAEQVPERLAHVVYLDALVPMDGFSSPSDFYSLEEWETMEATAEKNAGRWPIPDEHPGLASISDEDEQWLRSKAVPQPLNTLRQSVNIENPNETNLPSSYILCTANGEDDTVLNVIRQLCDEREWGLREIETGHWPMVSMPEQLNEQINAVVEE